MNTLETWSFQNCGGPQCTVWAGAVFAVWQSASSTCPDSQPLLSFPQVPRYTSLRNLVLVYWLRWHIWCLSETIHTQIYRSKVYGNGWTIDNEKNLIISIVINVNEQNLIISIVIDVLQLAIFDRYRPDLIAVQWLLLHDNSAWTIINSKKFTRKQGAKQKTHWSIISTSFLTEDQCLIKLSSRFVQTRERFTIYLVRYLKQTDFEKEDLSQAPNTPVGFGPSLWGLTLFLSAPEP